MTDPNRFPDPAERYVQRVLERVPRPLPERDRIAVELRSHLEERTGAGVPAEEAVAGMAPPEEVAREYLAEIDFIDATLPQRVGAFLLDLGLGVVCLLPVAGLVLFLILRIGDMRLMLELPLFPVAVFLSLLVAAVAALSVLYFPAMEAIYGQTLGKRWVGIYVTREDGSAAGWAPAIIRRLPFLLEIFWIDALFALFTGRRQRAFDLVARTVVVRR